MDTRTNLQRERIERVRAVLAQQGAHALLVPTADPHLSEYLPARWQGRQWLSGFTGSMGTLVITRERAALFADGRYWVQAERELVGSGIELEKIPSAGSQHHVEWIVRTLARGQTLMVDGQVLELGAAQRLRTALEPAGIALRTDTDLLAQAWPERPAPPAQPVYAHPAPQAVAPRTQRLARVREAMAQHGATHHFVSTVDDVAWITALRGADVEYNPVFLAHLLIEAEGAPDRSQAPSPPSGGGTPQGDPGGRHAAVLFIGAGKVDAALAAQLARDGIALADYAAAPDALRTLPAGSTLLLDPQRITLGFRQLVPAAVRVVEAINPSTLFKSRKSEPEAQFVRETMARDGAAMCAFYAGFEAALARGERITELTIDERLTAERAKQPGYVGLSFSTIAAFNANGAQPHYRATDAHHAVIEGDGLLLIDSGGQYLGGTTDITRVWPIGRVSAAQRRDCTLVLKAMMSLSRARFPRGTLSPMIDAIARAPLWEHGIDYGHGTGHGVGYFLNVHEGPQRISQAVPEPQMAMQPGMITSIEPGVYRPGQWGVRIENLGLTVAVDTPEHGAFGEMLEFETLTLCPIDTRCIEPALLRADEREWLDRYHAQVRERLAPLVSGAALAWLLERTQPLPAA
ncbi:MAG: aminopeptidase P family protein [Ideonella sp.]|nr:aminopeptidase P family protein [Ideonella sp.]MCC7456627.1 aminopeptidase P family protein [Nitrospira sp.]